MNSNPRRLPAWTRRILGRRVEYDVHSGALDYEEFLRRTERLTWDAPHARKRLSAAYQHLTAVAKNAYKQAADDNDQPAIDRLDAIHDDLVDHLRAAIEQIRDKIAAPGDAGEVPSRRHPDSDTDYVEPLEPSDEQDLPEPRLTLQWPPPNSPD